VEAALAERQGGRKSGTHIVSHAMQSNPADRYQQASEVKIAVSQITRQGREGLPSLRESAEAFS